VITRANRVVARMQARLKVVSDEFLAHDIYTQDGSIDFDKFFKAADECGHQYGTAMCTCTLCQQLRPKLLAAIGQAMSPQPQQGAK
jgi:hypothetical protein